MHGAPTILPGLTTTKPERIPAFLEDMGRFGIDRIALFPTCLDPAERRALYAELERIPGLRIPHVHLRADADETEIDYLAGRFSTEVFNIHPRRSTHPFPAIPEKYRARIFVENVDIAPEEEEIRACGGLCLDYSHWENAKRFSNPSYAGFEGIALRSPIGCCHVSALRPGVPNIWNGGWDHHEFSPLEDFDYLAPYAAFLPPAWISLELENPLSDQIAAASRVALILSPRAESRAS